MTQENFTYRGIKFIWNKGGERYEGISRYLTFYIEQVEGTFWTCFIYDCRIVTNTAVAESGVEFSKTGAIDQALRSVVRHFELELELSQLRLNDAVAILQND